MAVLLARFANAADKQYAYEFLVPTGVKFKNIRDVKSHGM